jgi:hypothetical protein
MVKKLVLLSQNDIDYVQGIANKNKSQRSKKGDFGKALSKIIKEHKNIYG